MQRSIGLAVAIAMGVTAPALPVQAQEVGAEVELAEVTVTGSRIVRRDLEAASPIFTVEAERFENITNVGLEAALNQLPQFQPSRSQFTASDSQASAFSSPGSATLNLRGIGSNRGLVLLDGRRAQPSNATLAIDLNSIPAAAIENVEVISGGASSVYGADAIAGVVNFKLRRNFQGMDLSAQTGLTQQGDGAETRLSMLVGANLAEGRGNVLFGAELARREIVEQKDRRFYTDAWADPGTQITAQGLPRYGLFVPAATNLPSQAAVDAIFGGSGLVSRNTPFYVNDDGTVFKNTPVAGNPALSSLRYTGSMDGVHQNPDGTLSVPEGFSVSAPMERYALFGRGTFNVTDNLSMFVQANLSSSEVNTRGGAVSAVGANWNITMPRDAAHPVPPELAALLDSRPNPNAPFTVERVLDFVGGSRLSENQSTVFQAMFGLEGRLPVKDWTWEAYASHGETRNLNYLSEGIVSRERLRRIATAPNYGRNYSLAASGYQLRCTSGLPIFEYFTPSQDCLDAISLRLKATTNIKQDIFEANAQGGLLDLPMGELRAAVGASYRKNTAAFDPDSSNDTESAIDGAIGLFPSANTSGRTTLKEVYGELLVPLLRGVPLAQDLSLELGGRYSDYDTAGGSWTYKGLINWKTNDFLTLRGGYQVANRAPNIAELFLGITQEIVSFPDSDPCANTTRAAYGNVPDNPNRAQVQALCSAIIGSGTSTFDLDPDGFVGTNGGYFPSEREIRSGSLALKPEKADTWTAGIVLRSPFVNPALSRFTATVDWYSIKIKDTIAPLGASTVYSLCLNSNGVSNPTYSLDDAGGYCRLIYRDPQSGGRQSVQAQYANLGVTKTSGIDVQLNWDSALADLGMQSVPGRVSFNLSFNHLLDFTQQASPVSPPEDLKGTGSYYDQRLLSGLRYSAGDWSLGLNWQYLPGVKSSSYVRNPATDIRGTGSYSLFSLTGGVTVNEHLSLRAGIDNLLDRQPPVVGYIPGVTNARGSTNAGFYDVLGRRFFVGANLKF